MLYSDLRCDMSQTVHIVSVLSTNTEGRYRMGNNAKEVQVKLMKGLLDLIVLQFLNTQPMHGYQIITKIAYSKSISHVILIQILNSYRPNIDICNLVSAHHSHNRSVETKFGKEEGANWN